MPENLKEIINRIENGIGTEADIQALASAVQSKQITIATGKKAVALGGDVSDVVIVTGDNNIVIKGTSAEEVKQVFCKIEQITALFEESLLSINSRIPVDTSAILVTEHQAELDHAKDLINGYNYKQALEYLEKLKLRIWDNAQPIVRYRLLANIGIAKLSLHQYLEAGKYFIQSLHYNSEDENALYFAAVGNLLLGQQNKSEQLIHKVLKINPTNESAYALLIQLFPDEDIEVIINKVPEAYRNSARVAGALGNITRQKLDFVQAEKWLQIAIDNDTEKLIEIKADLGTLLLESFSKDSLLIYNQQLDDSDKNKIQKAIRLLTEAWNQIVNTDFGNLHSGWIFNCGIAKRILGLWEEAISDVNIALQIEPENPVFIREKAMLLQYYKGDNSQAINLLEGIRVSKEVPEAPLLIANILALTKNYSQAKEVVSSFIEQNHEQPLLEWAHRILIKLYIDTKDVPNAIQVYNSIQDKELKTANDLINLALLAKFLDDKNGALNFLQEARDNINVSTPVQWVLELANAFSFIGEYTDAVNLYEKIVNTNLDTPLNHTLIELYYNSGQFRKALRACQLLYEKYGASQFVCYMLSDIQESIGNLPEAKRVCNEYLQLSPDDLRMRIRLALINCRIDALDELDNFLNLPIDINNLSLELGLNIVYLYGFRGFIEKYFEVLYQLRKKFFNQGKAHFNYFVAFLERETNSNSLLEHTEVRANSAVCLQDKYGTSSWFILVDDENSEVKQDEINLKSFLAQKLLGKVIGDEVTLKDDYITQDTRKIIDIKSKYVYAFQKSLELLQSRFPETPGFWMVQIDINESKDQLPKSIQNVLDKSSENFLEVEKLYKQHGLPMGVFAKLVNRDVLSVWGGLINKEDLGIRCCIGTAEESNHANSLLITKPIRLIIDIVSVLTLHGLGAADVVVNAFGKLGIAQSTIDILQKALKDYRVNQLKESAFFRKEGNKYFIHETPPESVKSFADYLEKMISWINTNCEILPCNAALDIGRDERMELEELIGTSFSDTILIASEAGNLLYSDDLALRQVAKAKFDIDGVWTQLVLMHCQNINVFEKDDYNEAVIKLVLSNYHYTSIDAQALIEAAKKSDWLARRPFTNLLSLLSKNGSSNLLILNEQIDRMSLNSIITVTVKFIYELWRQQKMQQISDERRDSLVMEMLSAMVHGRQNRSAVIRKLITEVQQKFYLLPLHGIQIIQLIYAWKAVNII
ncbi:tetratricopeptide repeat protein [Nostoc sp. CCY 9925]|uniref:tetratricopeptide repeat protein n=1 Tax=Nostoc sp. CCY 9925 TaxID=3103865 RepID=UPI0039C6EAC1